ncbi:hypothetical protein C5167_037417 [Papaver somniferum]|uniref:Uncharacterized protein n=1 Tax=Papaver somniferum TaxID=3469 RepID=A0A4Y7IAL0_PAPSO|nr:uncharacterized protein LOC113328957 [Papaver somniferum]RZC44455.1 hypothetical protein C5167_037417 [Papaver somniferum]
MALTASTVAPFRFQIKLFGSQRFPVQSGSCLLLFPNKHRQVVMKCSAKETGLGQFSDPSKLKMQFGDLGDKLWQTFPEPVKEFPWKRAEDIMLQRLKEALKWSMITLFAFNSLSDILLSISKNKELMIPLGLFIGCAAADVFKETAMELFPSVSLKEEGLKKTLVAVGVFFIFVKVVSAYLALRGSLLLSHVGNGGLLQVLWLWRKLNEVDSPSLVEKSEK